ncbi:DUF6456 domain-containing protein [Prosthecomicrobium hirschii]|uniref:DUF6456 domain-containing protein n=1 Tax=Prosthecodimorpha hirschii TaxID=665126 RepID=UPI00128EE843|nr:DUF6456 domain-containing protein [Prosthecomicrobium hirschii]
MEKPEKIARLLAFLAAGPAEADASGSLRRIGVAGLARLRVDAADLERSLRDGLTARVADGTIALTARGRDRVAAAGGPAGRLVARRLDGDAADAAAVLVNDAESPLAWLFRRRGADGAPLVPEAEFRAGERLRIEFARAGLMPSVTSNWRTGLASAGGARGGPADATDAALAARDRVRRALDAVGPELSGILVDVCCFLKGLEAVEAERRWPARSAKVVLRLALARLAGHYDGPRPEARRSAPMRHWGAPDYRPEVNGGTAS